MKKKSFQTISHNKNHSPSAIEEICAKSLHIKNSLKYKYCICSIKKNFEPKYLKKY